MSYNSAKQTKTAVNMPFQVTMVTVNFLSHMSCHEAVQCYIKLNVFCDTFKKFLGSGLSTGPVMFKGRVCKGVLFNVI